MESLKTSISTNVSPASSGTGAVSLASTAVSFSPEIAKNTMSIDIVWEKVKSELTKQAASRLRCTARCFRNKIDTSQLPQAPLLMFKEAIYNLPFSFPIDDCSLFKGGEEIIARSTHLSSNIFDTHVLFNDQKITHIVAIVDSNNDFSMEIICVDTG